MKIFQLVLTIIQSVVSIVGKVASSTKKFVTREDVNKEVDELEKMKEGLKKSKYWRE